MDFKDLNVKPGTVILLKENTSRILFDIIIAKFFGSIL